MTESTAASVSVARLRSSIAGAVLSPEDAGYDAAREIAYGGIDRRPAAIVRPSGVDDVQRVVRFAAETGADLGVKCGGHSLGAFGLAHGGITLDCSTLKSFEVDLDAGTAWAGGGMTAGEVTAALAEHSLAVPFGDTATVGIGGLTLGGGVGYLVRKYGLTIDSLLAADLVTADGSLVHVDERSDPELFWAIRGGGGNFGVATRFKYRLRAVSRVVGGMLLLPATPDVVAGFVRAAEAAPNELSAIVNVMPAPPMPFVPEEHRGRLVVMALMAYVGDASSAEAVYAPFRALAGPIVDMIRPIRYVELFPPEAGGGFHPAVVTRTTYADSIDRAAATTILDRLESSDAPMRAVQLRVLGGAAADVPSDATAYAHRRQRIMVAIATFYDGSSAGKQARESWAEELMARLAAPNAGAYVNFLADEGEERVRQAYPGETWERLVAVKRRVDPANLFHLNQNVRP